MDILKIATHNSADCLGVLDDYGTGYSNAYRLSNLTPHYIKIDRVLTQKALSSNYEEVFDLYY